MEEITNEDLMTRIKALEARIAQVNDYNDMAYNFNSTQEIENLGKYLAKLLVEAQRRELL